MLSKVISFALLGIEAYPIEIEVDVTRGLPAVTIVGLADTAIRESRERIDALPWFTRGRRPWTRFAAYWAPPIPARPSPGP